MVNYCGLDGEVDLENARRTGQVYIMSGDWDPSTNPTKAPAGTIFMGNGGTVKGKLWQKQDDGCSTNWSLQTSGFIGSLMILVDPVLGDDTIGKPFKTLAAAFAKAATIAGPPIADCSPHFPRPVVVASPGRYLEPAPTLPYNVSLVGYGMDNTILQNGLNYVGGNGDAGRSDIIGIGIPAVFNVDCSNSCNTNIRFINSRCSLTWNGGPGYNVTHFNNFLGHASTFNDINIIDGAVHLYNNQGIFSSLTIGDGPVPTSFPFLEIVGGLVQGTVSVTGKGQVFARALLNEAAWTGVANGGGTKPLFESDRSSLPIGNGTLAGVWQLQIDDEHVRKITFADSPFTVTSEATIIADTALGAIAINVAGAADRKGFPLTVKRKGANNVTITPAAGTVEGGPSLVLGVDGQARTIESDNVSNYEITGGYL